MPFLARGNWGLNLLFLDFFYGVFKLTTNEMECIWHVGRGKCRLWRYLLGFSCFFFQFHSASSSKHTLESGLGRNVTSIVSVTIAGINFEEVASPFIITCFVMFAMLSKLAYHHAGFLSSIIPESCLQIFLGIVIGAIIYFSGYSSTFPDFFTPHEFFVYLLPPIILEAAYSLNDSIFYDNLGSVLIYAVIGTLLNCFLIGLSLWGLSLAPASGIMAIGFSNILVFTSVIVAVDPVAVLAIFTEMGVNATLYILVFGESLLNDGVSVVLYSVMQTYSMMNPLPVDQVFMGILKFFVVAIGGLLIGIIIGMFSALLTKHTFHVRVVEPVMVFGSAFLSYILADIFELSGIISLIGCGLTQAQYALHNVNRKSNIAIKYCIKVASTTSEIIIFLFLGMALVRYEHNWSTGFTLWTIFLCLIYRFLVVFGLTYLINTCDRYRVRKIGLDEQFIMGYGGLRGAVCFSLVMMLDEAVIPFKRMFVTTTLGVIIFTILIQGLTIKPLVKFLKVTLQKKEEPNCLIFLTSDVSDHLMAGMEDIIGFHGKYYLKELLEYYDDHYLKKWLQRKPTKADAEISKVYEKIMLRDHFKNLEMSGAKKFPDHVKKETENVPEELQFLHPDTQGESVYLDTWLNLYKSLKMNERKVPRSHQSVASFKEISLDFPSTSHENEASIPLQVIGSKDDDQSETPIRRLSRTLSGFRPKVQTPTALTSADVRNILRRQPTSRNLYHEKYDRDLTREEHGDLEHHLSLKRRMTQSLYVMRERNRSLTAESSQISQQPINVDDENSTGNIDKEKRKSPRRVLLKEEHVDIEDANDDDDSDERNSQRLNIAERQV